MITTISFPITAANFAVDEQDQNKDLTITHKDDCDGVKFLEELQE